MKLIRRLSIAAVFACGLSPAPVSSAENGPSSFGRLIERAKGVVSRQPSTAPKSLASGQLKKKPRTVSEYMAQERP
ncbi:MAG TPA: hypothetical protein VGJ16_12295 [Pirellulales bacterium]